MDFRPADGRKVQYAFISVNAPIASKEEYKKGYFYKNLEEVYDECNKFDIKIRLSDFNARVERMGMQNLSLVKTDYMLIAKIMANI